MSYSLWLFSPLCSLGTETSTHRSSLWSAGLSLPLVTSQQFEDVSVWSEMTIWRHTLCPPWDFFYPVNYPKFLQWIFFFLSLIFSFGLLFRKQPMLIRQTSQTVKNNESTPTWWQRLPSWYVSSQFPFCINNFNSQQFIQRDPCIKRWSCHPSV